MTRSPAARLARWLARTLLRITIDAGAWAAIQSAAGYGVHRLSLASLDHDSWITRPRRFERDGRFYADRLRIRRWKHSLPEAGALFAGGFDKARLETTSPGHLRRHVAETRRAEVGHWVALVPTPLFWRWNPRWLALVMTAYAVSVNGPCIAAQRYNRLRLLRVLGRLERQADPAATERRRSTGMNGSRCDSAARFRSSRGTTGNSIP